MQKDFTITLTPVNAEVKMIRVAVFQHEQGVAADLEFDGLDDAAQHVLAVRDDQPVGTARIRLLGPDTVKLERVAVLREHRSQGIGRAMMEFAMAHAARQGVRRIKLNAQLPVVDFYTSLGFVATSDVFDEAGIPHVSMSRCLA